MLLEQMLIHAGNLDGGNSFYHGGIKDRTEVETFPHCQKGNLCLWIPAKDNKRPLHISFRHSTYELLGPNSNETVAPGHVISAFHNTKLQSLFEATRMEAWPHQCGGGNYMDIGNGILEDFALCGGTCSHDGKSGTNFYLHFEIALEYLLPDEVMVQLWVSESTKLSGGKYCWGRYCSTCKAGHRNDKVSIVGIHIPVALLEPTTQKRTDFVSPPMNMTPFSPSKPFEIGSVANVVWPYSGKECAPSKQSHEAGYLQVVPGEQVTMESGAYSGHEGNAFPSYVYCRSRRTKVSHGWLPQLILHREGCGAFGVISGLIRQSELNDTIVRVLGLRDDGRVVGETAGRQIALMHKNVSILISKKTLS